MPHSSDVAADRGMLLDEWVSTRAEIARLEARSMELLAARAVLFDEESREHPLHRDMVRRSMIAEYAAAGRLGNGTVVTAFADAEALGAHFPGLHMVLSTGAISAAHVHQVLAEAAPVREAVRNQTLPAEALAMYEAACLVVAEQDSAARTRVHARQIAAALTSATLADRHRHAASERNVRMRRLDDGMAELTVVLPEIYAVAILDRLRQLATQIALTTRTAAERDEGLAFSDPVVEENAGLEPHAWVTAMDFDPDDPAREIYERIESGTTYAIDPEHDAHDPETDTCFAATLTARERAEARREFVAGDGRTRRQIETDTLIDLLLAGRPSAVCGTGLESITATVQVTIAAATLSGQDDRPAELDGHGPLDPDIARMLAADAKGWNRLFLTPDGRIERVDRYQPTEAMRRYLRARDQRCRFPGCHTPAACCQLDHNREFSQGGATELANLAHLCAGHHPLKHPDLDEAIRWEAHQLPSGDLVWTSPLGRTHLDRAPRRVMFV